ncbi:UNVERIFIED_CONTAM: hypothetical protein FKN15_007010 [Acipenser sinensis]
MQATIFRVFPIFLCFFTSTEEEEESLFQTIGRLKADGKAVGSCSPQRNFLRNYCGNVQCHLPLLMPQGATSADILSIAASEEADEQELAFPSEDVESDSASPAVKLSLSAELLLLIKRAFLGTQA